MHTRPIGLCVHNIDFDGDPLNQVLDKLPPLIFLTSRFLHQCKPKRCYPKWLRGFFHQESERFKSHLFKILMIIIYYLSHRLERLTQVKLQVFNIINVFFEQVHRFFDCLPGVDRCCSMKNTKTILVMFFKHFKRRLWQLPWAARHTTLLCLGHNI